MTVTNNNLSDDGNDDLLLTDDLTDDFVTYGTGIACPELKALAGFVDTPSANVRRGCSCPCLTVTLSLPGGPPRQ